MKVLTEDMDKVVSLPKLPEKRMYEKTFGEIGKKKRSVFLKTSTSSQGETLNEILFLKKRYKNTLNKNPGSLVSQNLIVQMDSTQVLCKKDAFVLNFEFKQYRARVNHVARERSLNLSFGRSQGPERGRNAETVTAKERFVL